MTSILEASPTAMRRGSEHLRWQRRCNKTESIGLLHLINLVQSDRAFRVIIAGTSIVQTMPTGLQQERQLKKKKVVTTIGLNYSISSTNTSSMAAANVAPSVILKRLRCRSEEAHARTLLMRAISLSELRDLSRRFSMKRLTRCRQQCKIR